MKVAFSCQKTFLSVSSFSYIFCKVESKLCNSRFCTVNGLKKIELCD